MPSPKTSLLPVLVAVLALPLAASARDGVRLVGWDEIEVPAAKSLGLSVEPSGDSLRDWTKVLLDIIRVTRAYPPPSSRSLAMLHLAIHDALAAADSRHSAHLFTEVLDPSLDQDHLIAGAAHELLVALYPSMSSEVDAFLSRTVGSPEDPMLVDALEGGRRSARAIISNRTGDGASVVMNHPLTDVPGRWRPTRPGFRPAISPHFPYVLPFAIPSGDAFRCPPPPSLTSERYTADHEEVRLLGDYFSTTRTAEETDIVYFWADEPGTFLPPGHWIEIALNSLEDTTLSTMARARVMALVSISLVDAAIAAWDSKYHYDAWRPYTAIVLADQDGNPATVLDRNWSTLITTPPHPDYPSGHSVFSGAAARVLERLLGAERSAWARSDLLPEIYGRPNQVRHWASFMEAAEEASKSRVLGGIHFRYACDAGLVQGIAVGDHVVDNVLLPPETSGMAWLLF